MTEALTCTRELGLFRRSPWSLAIHGVPIGHTRAFASHITRDFTNVFIDGALVRCAIVPGRWAAVMHREEDLSEIIDLGAQPLYVAGW